MVIFHSYVNVYQRVPPFQETLHILRSCWLNRARPCISLGKFTSPNVCPPSTLNAFFLNGYLRIIQVPSSNQTWQLNILTYTYTYAYITHTHTYIYIYMCILKNTHTHTDIYIYIQYIYIYIQYTYIYRHT